MDGFHSSQKANLLNFGKLFPGGHRSGTGLSLKIYFWNLFLAYGRVLMAANGIVYSTVELSDPAKSLANKDKHGIDFDHAQKLWLDPRALYVAAKNLAEDRFAIIAELDAIIWFAVYTMRSGGIRIITVRRARQYEKNRYKQND